MFANLPYARTPDSRFTDVPDWPYEPSYLVLDAPSGLRVAVYDATNDAAKSSSSPPETFFCLHGEPTWSFLYRKMASVFLSRDVPTRFVAFDFMGFGRSDKPTRSEDYSYERHRETAIAVVRHCSIKNATLVVQDWGSLLGLTLPHEFEKPSMDAKDRAFTRLILMNGWLPTGDTSNAFIGNGFMRWKGVAAAMSPDMPVDFIMRSATGATKKVVEAYDAPFPSVEHKMGPVRFPQLVPIDRTYPGTDHAVAAQKFYHSLKPYEMPTFVAIGLKDEVLGARNMEFIINDLGAGKGWGVIYINEANHFVQEDAGTEVAAAALHYFAHLRENPVPPLPDSVAKAPIGISEIKVTKPVAKPDTRLWKPSVPLLGSWTRFFIDIREYWTVKAQLLLIRFMAMIGRFPPRRRRADPKL